MKFYTQQHRHYCGIDLLHARSMYICVLDRSGKLWFIRSSICDGDEFLRILRPYRKDLVIAVECLFCCYWIAVLCAEQGITFVLDHALDMKAIQGGKNKTTVLTPTRSPPCCAAAISLMLTSTPRQAGHP